MHVHEADPFVLSTAKKYGIKRIIIHSRTTSYGTGIKAKLKKQIEKIAFTRYADYAFACSQMAAMWKYNGLLFKRKKVEIIRNAIASKLFEFDNDTRSKYRTILGIEDKFVIGHIGRLTAQKN